MAIDEVPPDDHSVSSTRRIRHAGGWRHEIRIPSVRFTRRPPGGIPVIRAFTHLEVRIGKDPESDLVLQDPSVSRFHATLRLTADGWLLADLESTNGTLRGTLRRKLADYGCAEPGDDDDDAD